MVYLNIYGMTLEKLEKYFEDIGSKKFHARQLFDWLYVKRIKDIDNVTNIKKEVIDKLKEDFSFDKIKIVLKQEDKDVYKYLFKLNDSEHIEAVVMMHDYGISICVSSGFVMKDDMCF